MLPDSNGKNVDAYAKLAQTVLRAARRPLNARSILNIGYKAGIVPTHLFGRTQHKTLNARISEAILIEGDQCLFFRTAPGTYFLREFIPDASLPEDFRSPISTRRRYRELRPARAMAFAPPEARKIRTLEQILSAARMLDLTYADTRSTVGLAYIKTFTFVVSSGRFLTYRLGRYREERDAYVKKRTFGFTSYVTEDDRTLFNVSFDGGVSDVATSSVIVDLGFPPVKGEPRPLASPATSKIIRNASDGTLFAIYRLSFPEWFEPTRRRLAVNDLRWQDLTKVNDWDDFEPTSRSVARALSLVSEL